MRRMWERWLSKQIPLGNSLLHTSQRPSAHWGAEKVGAERVKIYMWAAPLCVIGKPLGFSTPFLKVF